MIKWHQTQPAHSAEQTNTAGTIPIPGQVDDFLIGTGESLPNKSLKELANKANFQHVEKGADAKQFNVLIPMSPKDCVERMLKTQIPQQPKRWSNRGTLCPLCITQITKKKAPKEGAVKRSILEKKLDADIAWCQEN